VNRLSSNSMPARLRAWPRHKISCRLHWADLRRRFWTKTANRILRASSQKRRWLITSSPVLQPEDSRSF
jgi:hypothetical protein